MLPKNKKCSDQRNPGLDSKHVTKDDKEADHAKGVRCKLGWNDPEKIKDINFKGVKRKLKVGMKEFLIHSKMTRCTRCYPFIWSRSIDMDVVWKLVIFSKLKTSALVIDEGSFIELMGRIFGLLDWSTRRVSVMEETSISSRFSKLVSFEEGS